MPKRNPVERFWPKVERGADDECWAWTGAKAGGYGRFWSGERVVPAHRFCYELLVGPVAPDLHLDHLCRTPGCVNPAHLEPVTPRENVLRGTGFSARNARKDTCVKGHPLSGDNLYVRGGKRGCLTCRRSGQVAHYYRNREKKLVQMRQAYANQREKRVQYARDYRAAGRAKSRARSRVAASHREAAKG